MSKFKVQLSLIKYTGIFFILLTILTFSSFLIPPNDSSLSINSKTKRQPSSVFSIHNFAASEHKQVSDVSHEFYSHNIKCKNLDYLSNKTITSKGKNIRFKSKCLNAGPKHPLPHIKNTSNQHNGQFLSVHSHRLMTSDYISLNKGENLMELEVIDSNGNPKSIKFNVVY